MAKTQPKITLNQSRDIPFDRLLLSQSNVRKILAGETIAELAADIERRGLLTSLNVRPVLNDDGQETGDYEVPAGGRRYRALELLVKQKRLARDAPVPCIVKPADCGILAEDDSLAENARRESLHPLDQFRAMQAMAEKGDDVEKIAAHHFVTPAVVRQRLKLAGVSPALLKVYAEDGLSLEQIMAFTISDDFERQEAVFELLKTSFSSAPAFIRQKLTENSVRVVDKRVRFVGLEAYVDAGGSVVRDLFEADAGGWLTDPPLLDKLVGAKLESEAERIGGEGWKWVDAGLDAPWNASRGMRAIYGEEVPMTDEEQKTLADLETEGEALSNEWCDADEVPEEVHARLEEIDATISAITERPQIFDPAEIAIAGAFLSIEANGSLRIERGFVKAEDEPVDPEVEGGEGEAGASAGGQHGGSASTDAAAPAVTGEAAGEEEIETLKPLSERLVSDLTAWRTLALQDAFAKDPATAFVSVLHAFVLSCFFGYSSEGCVQVRVNPVSFSNEPPGLRDSAPGQAIAERREEWRTRMPKSDKDIWDWVLALGSDDQWALFAHCVSVGVNAQREAVKYDNGRISPHGVERRVAHSHVIARAVGLDVVAAGWKAKADAYLAAVPKSRILADVTEARGENFAQMIDHLKKADMAREAERLLEDTDWLPEPLRTPELEPVAPPAAANDDGAGELPPGLAESFDENIEGDATDDDDAEAVAAE
ncbi:chromosome partitioning protein ParB [Sphingopyxis sp. H050]|jgi:ParB family transcriptional regulator, chromosome partitioning protein|uniref:ParB/RepB/Spo0J family partition protein n=1 Tax=Sphingopyxis sp. H050 TaxID=1759072 RepID=UPI000736660A|nr:ParB/RepB/Spo0J family partition protein [Sphingopyxis sp. H050]KTE22816.1 chromosome partitioning protein ParB [Sphingopyxis sp. H050]